MIIQNSRFILFYAGKDGLGLRLGDNWFRLRPPWDKPMYSERNTRPPIAKAFGWRITKRHAPRI